MLDILCRLFSRNTQILAQSKRTDSIHNAEINCFCISSLQICPGRPGARAAGWGGEGTAMPPLNAANATSVAHVHSMSDIAFDTWAVRVHI